jgi:hypothetical protein
LTLSCKGLVAPTFLAERWDEFLRGLHQGHAQSWVWLDRGMQQTEGMAAATQALAAHFAGQSKPAAAFLKRHGLAAAPPTMVWPTAPSPSTAKAQAQASLTLGERWQLVPKPHRPFWVLGLLMTASTFFFATSLAWGVRWGFRAWMAVSIPLCLWLGRGEGAASVLLVGAGLSLCYALGMALSFAFRVFRGLST